MQVNGGPPAPKRWCAACGGELTGHPKHRMDSDGKLFCDGVCWHDYPSMVVQLDAYRSATFNGG